MRIEVIPTSRWGILIIIVLLLPFKTVCAQGTELMRTDLISPSPTASNLGKYGDIPLTYYTGLPNVSIPLFNVTGNELSVPITLSYHFSGLQPTQKASWVGLGWSIQAGGLITRTIGDKVEFGSSGYNKDSASNIGASQMYLKNSYQQAMYDNLPDTYSFNFGNYSGKFIWYNNVAYVMPDQKLKVGAGGAGFIITTEDGTKYEFGDPEQTSIRGTAGSPYIIPTHYSTWYLTKITNSTNTESIKLYYDSDGTIMQYGQRTQVYRELRESYGVVGYKVDPPVWPGPLNVVFPTKVISKRLSRIVSDKYDVHFNPGAKREDIEMASDTSKSLGSIVVYSSDNTPVKRLNFNYGYFSGVYGTVGTACCGFLKLQSVVEDNFLTSAEFMKHEFEYFETSSFGAGSLSYVDKYGYSKTGGAISNMIISNEVYQYGVDRTPNFSAMVTGALKKITYPTGGGSDFNYEENRYYDGDKYVTIPEYAGVQDYSENHTIQVDTFQIFADTHTNVTFSRTPKTIYDPSNAPVNIPGNVREYEIKEIYFTIDEFGNKIEHEGTTILSQGTIVLYANNGGETKPVFLQSGKYILRAICDQNESYVEAHMLWDHVTDVPQAGALGPGIRLKDITHDNGFGKLIKKKFFYVNSGGFSSGRVLQNNLYSSQEFRDYYYGQYSLPGVPWWTNVFVNHTSMIAETNGVGLPFYYKRVVEETVSGEEIHRSDYSYDYFSGTKNVELIEKNDYLQGANTSVPLLKIENTYSAEIQGEAFGGMDVFVKANHFYGPEPTPEFGNEFKVQAVYWKHPVKTQQTQYEHGQTKITETKSYFDVNGTRNLTATKTVLSDGSCIFTKYKYPEDYSGISSISSLVSGHILSPVIEEQVWKKTTASASDSILIGGRINEYSGMRISAVHQLEIVNGIPSLNNQTMSGGKYTSLISDTRYKKKIDFKYDLTGRVIQQQLTDHPIVSYLWAYPALALSGSPIQGKVYPIAEIQNAKADSVFYSSFEDATGTTMISVTGSKAKANPVTIPGSFNGKYKLTYWKKVGVNNWELVEELLTNPNNYVINIANSFIDEVRLHPVKAQMTTYSYQTGVGISKVNDPNNKITYYEYDAAGRLKRIKEILLKPNSTMLKINSFLLLLSSIILFQTMAYAQEDLVVVSDTLLWKAESCTDKLTNITTSTSSDFVTYGSYKVVWTQSATEQKTVFEFNTVSVDDHWSSGGYVVFNTTRKNKAQEFKFERVNSTTQITLTYATPTGEQQFVFTINTVLPAVD